MHANKWNRYAFCLPLTPSLILLLILEVLYLVIRLTVCCLLFECCCIVYEADTALTQHWFKPSSHKTLNQCWFTVGPPSTTLYHDSTSCVCWKVLCVLGPTQYTIVQQTVTSKQHYSLWYPIQMYLLRLSHPD